MKPFIGPLAQVWSNVAAQAAMRPRASYDEATGLSVGLLEHHVDRPADAPFGG